MKVSIRDLHTKEGWDCWILNKKQPSMIQINEGLYINWFYYG